MATTKYKSYNAQMRAVKDIARNQGRLTSSTEQDFRYSRFLHRLFADPSSDFVLKGGMSLLARIPNARTTRDIDVSVGGDKMLDDGISAMKRAVAVNAGDHLFFEYAEDAPITGQGDDALFTGRRLFFDVYGGGLKVDRIQVDLVAGCEISDTPIKYTPLNRIFVPGLEYTDYLLYPIVDQIADKVSATIQQYHSGSSSRMRDLVDLVLIALNESFSAEKLSAAFASKAFRSQSGTPSKFIIPDTWQSYQRALLKFVPNEFKDIDRSVELVSSMLNPILAGERKSGIWNPELLEWTD